MRRPDLGRGELTALMSYGPRVVRAKWGGVIALGVGLAATAALAQSTTRLYRSEAVIVFEHGVQAGAAGRESESPRAIAARLQEMLMSRQRLDAVIKEMNLYRSLLERRGSIETIEEMRKHIAISNRDGFTYRVSYDGESRDLTKSVLERLTSGVVADDANRRKQEADDAKKFLDTEREQADRDLKQKEEALAAFLTKHPQLAAEAGTPAAAGGLIRAADRDRAGADNGVAALEMQAAQLEGSLAATGGSHVVVGRREVAADPELVAAHTRAQTELHAAQKDLAEKQLHLTNEHPDMKQSMRRLTTAEAAERRAAAALAAWRPPTTTDGAPVVVDDPASSRDAAVRRALAAVRQQIAVLRSRSAPRAELPKAPTSVVAIDTEWTRLNREVSEARERQNQLESKQFQAELAATLAAGGQAGQLVVADPPFRPVRPVAGGRLKVALVGSAASLALALMVVLVFAVFDDRLYASRDLENVLPEGIIVVIPKVPRSPPVEEPEAPAASAATGEG
jgi:hypothetical protein